jgi:sugar lactone lactonase YvrE
MGKLVAIILALLVLLLLYLLFWPVPVSPVAWDAPQDRGLVDPYAANDRLGLAKPVSIGDFEGPEDIAGGPDGYFYASSRDGQVIRFLRDGAELGVFAETGGRPLGLEFDLDGNLWVANAPLGLQKITPDGIVETIVSDLEGEPINYADDLAIAADGRVFFSDASSKHNPATTGGSYEASLLDILEHGGHGRIFEYSPATKQTRIILDGLNFANGVAISEDQQFLLVNETGHYRVLKYYLEGPDAGRSEVILDNLPGFPDNINNGLTGKFWIGLVAPRSKIIDDLSGLPRLRKMIQRLPAFVRPKAVPSSHVIAIDGNGNVLMNLQGTQIRYPALTGVFETSQSLYLTTLFGNQFGRLDKRDLQ